MYRATVIKFKGSCGRTKGTYLKFGLEIRPIQLEHKTDNQRYRYWCFQKPKRGTDSPWTHFVSLLSGQWQEVTFCYFYSFIEVNLTTVMVFWWVRVYHFQTVRIDVEIWNCFRKCFHCDICCWHKLYNKSFKNWHFEDYQHFNSVLSRMFLVCKKNPKYQRWESQMQTVDRFVKGTQLFHTHSEYQTQPQMP